MKEKLRKAWPMDQAESLISERNFHFKEIGRTMSHKALENKNGEAIVTTKES